MRRLRLASAVVCGPGFVLLGARVVYLWGHGAVSAEVYWLALWACFTGFLTMFAEFLENRSKR